MSKRERFLAIAVGVLMATVGGVVAARTVLGWFASRDEQILQLDGQLQNKQMEIDRAARLRKRLAEYEERSLPWNDELAPALYAAWLTEQIEKSGLEGVNINPTSVRPKGDAFKAFAFSVTARGDVSQLTSFLHHFYSADHLHKVVSLGLSPIAESRHLDMNMTIEALAVSTAAPDKPLSTKSGRLLAHKDKERYLETIVGRNFFGPPNNPPKLDSIGEQRAIIRRPFSLDLKATDADPHDAVTYAMVGQELHGARLDEKNGQFRWTPPSLGKFSFTVRATDDGFPAKSSTQTFVVQVSDPPPPPAPQAPPPRPLGFDHSKHAYATGIVSKGGRRQLWLTVRTTGQQLRLFEGDAIELGSLKGRLLWLTDREGEIVTEAGRIMFGVGDCLGEAEMIKTSAPAAPSDASSGASG